MSRERYGTGLLVGGIALFVVMIVASVALAGTPGVNGSTSSSTLVGVQGGGFGLHEHGSVGLYDARGRLTWAYEGANSYFDVTMLENGTVLAGFMSSGYDRCGPYEAPCSRTGFQVIDPGPEPRVIDQYSFPVRTKQNSETHDVERLPSGNYIVTDMEHERIAIVTPDGERVWAWNASSRYPPPEDPTKADWLHINDVDRIGDGRYLVSVRNANQVLVIERGEGVTDVINEDGNGDLLFRQHNPQWLAPGAVLVADSGNDRIVELHHNESTGGWEIAWSIRKANGISFDWPRDADRLPNGNTLVTDTVNYRVLEVNQAGEVVWSMTTEYKPYEADRVPVGETVGGPLYENSTGPSGDGGGDGTVPVLTRAFHLLRVSAPLPYWFSQWHLLGTAVSLALTAVGGVVRLTGE